jgi:hypothetical protein
VERVIDSSSAIWRAIEVANVEAQDLSLCRREPVLASKSEDTSLLGRSESRDALAEAREAVRPIRRLARELDSKALGSVDVLDVVGTGQDQEWSLSRSSPNGIDDRPTGSIGEPEIDDEGVEVGPRDLPQRLGEPARDDRAFACRHQMVDDKAGEALVVLHNQKAPHVAVAHPLPSERCFYLPARSALTGSGWQSASGRRM